MGRLHGRQRGECWRVEEGLLGKVPSEQKPKRSERMSPRTPGWGVQAGTPRSRHPVVLHLRSQHSEAIG